MLGSLLHFALIVEHGTFREAARHAHLTQPALTASIQRLEAEMGVRLLHRGRGGAEPTVAGTALLPHARAALAEIARGRGAALEAAGLEASEVKVAAGATVSTYVLPAIAARFRKDHPSASFHLRELPTDEAIHALETRAVDIAIVSGAIVSGATVSGAIGSRSGGRPWLADELVLVGAPSLDPREAPLLVFARGAGSRDVVDRYFPERRIAMELGSIAALLAHARAGAGLALVSRFALEGELGQKKLRIIPDRRTPVRRRLKIVHHEPKRMPRAAREFLSALFEAAR